MRNLLAPLVAAGTVVCLTFLAPVGLRIYDWHTTAWGLSSEPTVARFDETEVWVWVTAPPRPSSFWRYVLLDHRGTQKVWRSGFTNNPWCYEGSSFDQWGRYFRPRSDGMCYTEDAQK